MHKSKFLIFLLLLPFILRAEHISPETKLVNHLKKLVRMTAHFEQRVVDLDGQLLQKTKGIMYLQKPWNFHWAVIEPYEQKLIIDGKYIWNYEPDLEQVSKHRLDDGVKGTPAYLLAGDVGDEIQKFNVTEKISRNKMIEFILLPKSEGDEHFESIKLFFNKSQLKKMILKDQVGNQSIIQFSKVNTQKPIPNELFQFTVPKDVDVVE